MINKPITPIVDSTPLIDSSFRVTVKAESFSASHLNFEVYTTLEGPLAYLILEENGERTETFQLVITGRVMLACHIVGIFDEKDLMNIKRLREIEACVRDVFMGLPDTHAQAMKFNQTIRDFKEFIPLETTLPFGI